MRYNYVPKRAHYKVRMMADLVIELNIQCAGSADKYIIGRKVDTLQDLEDVILDFMNDVPGLEFNHFDKWDKIKEARDK